MTIHNWNKPLLFKDPDLRFLVFFNVINCLYKSTIAKGNFHKSKASIHIILKLKST